MFLEVLCVCTSHVVLGLFLGGYKERLISYSFSWWLVSSTFLLLLALNLPHASYPILTMFLGSLSSAFGQLLGGSFRAIGLTGGIATGKSTVSKYFREHRIPVIDSDEIAKLVMQPGYLAYNRTVAHFGKDNICSADGSIDRKKLGTLVFNNPSQLAALNNCTHWSICFEIVWQLLKYRFVKQQRLVVLDAPLLYETRVLPFFCFPIIVVSCSAPIQLERLMQRDGLTQEQAEVRIKAQWPLEEKVKRCDIVIDNSGTLEQLRQRAMEALRTTTKLLDGKVDQQKSQRTTL